MVFHSFELSDHVEFGPEPIIEFGRVMGSFPHLPNLELLLTPTTDLVDERRGGLDVRELFDEPQDILFLEVLLHHTFEKEWMRGCLLEPKHVDEPTFANLIPPVALGSPLRRDLPSKLVFHPPVTCQLCSSSSALFLVSDLPKIEQKIPVNQCLLLGEIDHDGWQLVGSGQLEESVAKKLGAHGPVAS